METALVKVRNDILSLRDDGRVTASALLDLSTAFDTIDHPVLLRRLNDWLRVIGKVLDWKILDDCLSKDHLPFGVPLGSILGSLFFTLYTTSLRSVNSGHAITHHLDADGSQLYVPFASGDSAAALNGLQS